MTNRDPLQRATLAGLQTIRVRDGQIVFEPQMLDALKTVVVKKKPAAKPPFEIIDSPHDTKLVINSDCSCG